MLVELSVEVWFRLSVDDPEQDRSEGWGEGDEGGEEGVVKLRLDKWDNAGKEKEH